MSAKKDQTQKPIFTKAFVIILVVIAGLSAGLTYKYRTGPTKKKDQKKKNEYVHKLRKVPKEVAYPRRPSALNRYKQLHVFSGETSVYGKKRLKPLEKCYHAFKKKRKKPLKKIKGKPRPPRTAIVNIEFHITKQGKVEKPKVFKSDLMNDKVHGCLLGHITKWTFPPHNFDKPIRHYFPVQFYRY